MVWNTWILITWMHNCSCSYIIFWPDSLLFTYLSACNYRALVVAYESSNLTWSWTGMKIPLTFFLWQFFHSSFYPNLLNISKKSVLSWDNQTKLKIVLALIWIKPTPRQTQEIHRKIQKSCLRNFLIFLFAFSFWFFPQSSVRQQLDKPLCDKNCTMQMKQVMFIVASLLVCVCVE